MNARRLTLSAFRDGAQQHYGRIGPGLPSPWHKVNQCRRQLLGERRLRVRRLMIGFD